MSRVPYNKLLTNLASSSRTGEYWPSVVFVRTSRCSVRTVTTSGQYSPVRPSRSVSKRLSITINKPEIQRFCLSCPELSALSLLSNYCSRPSTIWSVMQIEGVIRQSRRLEPGGYHPPRSVYLHIIRKPSLIIVLLFIQNIYTAKQNGNWK